MRSCMRDSPEHLRALSDRSLAAADQARDPEEQIRFLEAALRFAQAAYRLSRDEVDRRIGADERF